MSSDLGSRRYRKLRAEFFARCKAEDAPCWMCGQGIDYRLGARDPEAFELDHYYPRSTHPELTLDPGNFRASHKRCNVSRGNRMFVNEVGETSREWADFSGN
ncbi:HNH endonuclease [Devriesea agamarum]|uniref:HNH endonuclease n=1 Tax=Devriesea agamarum TaxID=472569 RepID=UPI000A033E7A|nr:HNH endonuclease [Devriesea agamarum]